VTVIKNCTIQKYKGIYNHIKLENVSNTGIPENFPILENRYSTVSSHSFSKIPGTPISYWVKQIQMFNYPKLSSFLFSGGRNKTHNNQLYVRCWWEPSHFNNRWCNY